MFRDISLTLSNGVRKNDNISPQQFFVTTQTLIVRTTRYNWTADFCEKLKDTRAVTCKTERLFIDLLQCTPKEVNFNFHRIS